VTGVHVEVVARIVVGVGPGRYEGDSRAPATSERSSSSRVSRSSRACMASSTLEHPLQAGRNETPRITGRVLGATAGWCR